MNLNKLFPEQKKLDGHIIEKHNLQGVDLLNKKTVALICELYECVNEFPAMFKFWKTDTKIDRKKLLEEYTDINHFSISIANDLGYHSHEYTDIPDMDLNELVIGLTNVMTLIPQSRSKKHISLVLDYVIKLGYQLGFTEKDVISAYFDKNEKNHSRQENGY